MMTVEQFKAGIGDAIAAELVDKQSRHIFNDDLDDIVESVYAYVTTAFVPARFVLGQSDQAETL